MAVVPPRRPTYWIPDRNSNQCKTCKEVFGYVSRKHHCRHCGHIFCHACCGDFSSIPNYLAKTLRYSDARDVRLCKPCYQQIKAAKSSRRLVDVLSLLPIDTADFRTLLLVSKRWKTAAAYVVSVFKGIQHKTTYERFSKLEKRLVKNHWKTFAGHSKHMLQALRCLSGIVDNHYLSDVVRHFKDGPRRSCASLFCDPTTCSERFTMFELVELLYNFPGQHLLDNEEFEVWAGALLVGVDIGWLSIFVSYILTLGTSEACQRLVHNYVLPRVLENRNFAFKFYFECRLCKHGNTRVADYYVALMERELQLVTQELRDELTKADMLVYFLEHPSADKQDKIDQLGDICMPYDPNVIVHKVRLDKMKQLNTFTKPFVVPMETNQGDVDILIKKEDVRKDRLVVTVAYLLDQLVPDVILSPYSILPVHQTYGWVEMVKNVVTLYDLEQSTTLQNYILDKNAQHNVAWLRKRFVQTCGSNAMLTYMLGIGDRNLHNILVRENGELLNIDFSYILGDDPKFTHAEMNITKGMVNMLGGKDSEGFHAMQRFCSGVYRKLRAHSNLWYTMFLYLARTTPPLPHDMAEVRAFHEERLMANYTEEESIVRICEIVDRNSNQSWKNYLSEYSHSLTTTFRNLMFDMEI